MSAPLDVAGSKVATAHDRLPVRARVASFLVATVNRVSRVLGLGSGTVIGGRIGLFVDPGLLRSLSAGHRVVLVSATNGKTTTTRLLVAALCAQWAGCDPGTPSARPDPASERHVVTNATGANMPAGHVAALVAGRRASGRGESTPAPVVLEVDEGHLPRVMAETAPEVVVLMNLSRDQLDRISEVRMLAGRWREALVGAQGTMVVANADDPMVVWAASKAPKVTWVAAGPIWQADAVGCPSCDGRIEFTPADTQGHGCAPAGAHGDWSCPCGFRRPQPDAYLDGDDLVLAEGSRVAVTVGIPGRFNRANAAMATLAARVMGVEERVALAAMASVDDVAGRFSVMEHDGRTVRLLLAKNPAGWTALLDLLSGDDRPVVVAINAHVADGKDPSWLWDVPFERLRGREVVAAGERCFDLAVRLRYADVSHRTEPVLKNALDAATSLLDPPRGNGAADRSDGELVSIGNYTAFQQLRVALTGVGKR